MEELVHEYMVLTNMISDDDDDLTMNTSSLHSGDLASTTNNSLVKFYHKVFWDLSGEPTKNITIRTELLLIYHQAPKIYDENALYNLMIYLLYLVYRSPDKGLVPAGLAYSRHRHNDSLSVLRPVVGTTSHGAPQALCSQAHSSHLQLLSSPPQLLAVLRRPRRCLAQTLQLEVRARRFLQLAPRAQGIVFFFFNPLFISIISRVNRDEKL